MEVECGRMRAWVDGPEQPAPVTPVVSTWRKTGVEGWDFIFYIDLALLPRLSEDCVHFWASLRLGMMGSRRLLRVTQWTKKAHPQGGGGLIYPFSWKRRETVCAVWTVVRGNWKHQGSWGGDCKTEWSEMEAKGRRLGIGHKSVMVRISYGTSLIKLWLGFEMKIPSASNSLCHKWGWCWYKSFPS